MNPASIALASIVPVTAVASKQTVAAAKSVGSAFAGLFSAPANARQNDAQSPSQGVSLGEAIRSMADELRGWLSKHGVSGKYSINYRLDSSGEAALDVTGDSAPQVTQLLATDTSWQAKLRSLATRSQFESVQRGASEPPTLTIEIDDENSSYY